MAVGDSFILMRDGEMHPAGGGLQSLGLITGMEGLQSREGQERCWVGLDGRRGGESVIWVSPLAQLPSLSGYRGSSELPKIYSPVSFKGLPLS